MPALTTTYSFNKPTVGGDTSVWGGFLNDNWDDIDALLTGTSEVSRIAFDGGTVALPAMTFFGDLNTGFYSPAGDQIGMTTGGTRRALLSSAAYQIDVPITGTSVQSSATDTTAGRLMAVGAFGLGLSVNEVTDWNNITTSGFFYVNNGVTNQPTTGTNWICFVARAANVNNLTQLACSTGTTPIMYVRSRSAGTWNAWQQVYNAGSLLGTVSQSSGVPTGAVIERGSNANGEYVRFADGTQICTIDAITSNSAADVTWTYPAVFASLPVLAGVGVGSADRIISTGSAAPGTTSTSFRAWAIAGTPARSTTSCRLTATGRWF